MKETIPPVISVVVNGTSVTYSYSPSLQGCADILPIFLFESSGSLDARRVPVLTTRATIGLSAIRDTLHSLKPRGACTTWPCCYAIPGVSSTFAS